MTFDPKQKIECDLSFEGSGVEVTDEGFITGIASTSRTDLAGHKVLAHAFDKSIQRKGLGGPSGVQLLHQHVSGKPIGTIKRLETRGDALNIEAQLALKSTYVRDIYEVAKVNNGFSFSVGFYLDEFEFIEEKDSKDGEYLVVKSADLVEVSLVTFPCQPDAVMHTIKSHETLSELEKALVAEGFCRSRNEAQKLAKHLKANEHLFLDRSTPEVRQVNQAHHPLPDVSRSKACIDLAARANRLLR